MNGLISRHGISLNRRLPEIRESFVKLIKQIIKRGKHLYERSTRYKLNPWIISVTSAIFCCSAATLTQYLYTILYPTIITGLSNTPVIIAPRRSIQPSEIIRLSKQESDLLVGQICRRKYQIMWKSETLQSKWTYTNNSPSSKPCYSADAILVH